MKPAIEVIGLENCAGCFSCYNSCPFEAIEMKESGDGFYYPYVNEKCKDCGICQEHCPVIRPVQPKVYDKPKFYAGWSKDDKIRIKSSSGGIFPELARLVLERGGVVFGVAWDGLKPVHVKIGTQEDIQKLSGSKYLQSWVGSAYREAIEEAKKGKEVLFSGTPCQVAALNTFLSDEIYQKVITVGLVCHGVPSMLVFRKYTEWIERKYGKVSAISFRDKRKGWEDFCMVLKLENGKEIARYHYLDPFFYGYLKNLYLRSTCYKCPFAKIPRFEDITLGDFWGYPKELKDKRGVSVVLANTQKGLEKLLELRDKGRIELKEVEMEVATRGNPRIFKGELSVPPIREKILKEVRSKPFGDIIEEYLSLSLFQRIFLLKPVRIGLKFASYIKRSLW